MPNLRWIKNNGKEELYDGDVKLAYLYKRKNDINYSVRKPLTLVMWLGRKKYLGENQVVGVMASPIGNRYKPNMQCSL